MKSRHYLSLAALAAALAAVALPGCGGGGGGGGPAGPPADTLAPSITGASLDRTTLRFAGGPVVVSASVTDAGSGVKGVTATIRKPDNSTQAVTLASAGSGTFQATWTAPANVASDQPVSYTVTLQATDVAGNVASVPPLTLMVEATDLPPPPPPPAP